MSIERFWLNIRTAASQVLPPSVAADSPLLDESSIARMLHGAATWLSPRAVDGFDPKHFDFLERAQQDALRSSVERFRAVASAVPGNKPASEQQIQEAGNAFVEILKILRADKFKDAETFRIQTLLERELQGKLPPWVESISCETGTDVSDDPAVWVWLNVTDEATKAKLIAKEGQRVHDLVESAVRRLEIPRWPYIWFQSLSELAENVRGRQ